MSQTIDEKEVQRIATLAKLHFTEEETKVIAQDLNRILGFCQKLADVDTEGVEPLIFMNDDVNSFREDEPHTPITHEEALKNAPDKNSDYFKVPKFLDKD